jgi:hypothetical protein
MIRLTFLLALVALGALIPLTFRLNGATAILFSFVGMPAMALALLLYGVYRWREGAFRAGVTQTRNG